MNKKLNKRNGLIHLYNPKKEGIGLYDVHYINAYKKNVLKNKQQKQTTNNRYAA
tara:strand:+ start:365 stop:526 length:162 start_codon:yes stop_codon:yes gene_type:complete